jgi:hypothetical protein
VSPRSKGWKDPEESARSAEMAPVGDVVRGLLGQRAFSRGVTVGRLARAWPDVVGERLAAETRPARLEAGVLTVQASAGPWGSQATFLAEEIRKRANDMLGTGVVKRVHVVVAPGLGDRPKPL